MKAERTNKARCTRWLGRSVCLLLTLMGCLLSGLGTAWAIEIGDYTESHSFEANRKYFNYQDDAVTVSLVIKYHVSYNYFSDKDRHIKIITNVREDNGALIEGRFEPIVYEFDYYIGTTETRDIYIGRNGYSSDPDSVLPFVWNTTLTMQEPFDPFNRHVDIYPYIKVEDNSKSEEKKDNDATVVLYNCNFNLNDSYESFNANGGDYIFNVDTKSGCPWTAETNDEWIHITPEESSGSDDGQISYSVDPNTRRTSRTGTITVGDKEHSVYQSGCLYTISDIRKSFSAPGGSYVFNLTTSSHCPWTASVSHDWIHLTSPTSGQGSAQVSYYVDENSNRFQRSGYITIGEKIHNISQAGCIYSISNNSGTFPATGGNYVFNLTTYSHCPWTASTSSDWIQLTSPTSGQGSTQISYYVDQNPKTASRTGTVTVAEKVHSVSQAKNVCSYSLAESEIILPVTSTSYYITLQTNSSECQWTASTSDSWIHITSPSIGTGGATIDYSIDDNLSGHPVRDTFT